jgi:hypothetical protein
MAGYSIASRSSGRDESFDSFCGTAAAIPAVNLPVPTLLEDEEPQPVDLTGAYN